MEEKKTRWQAFRQALGAWWQPLKWVTFIVILAVYALDAKHVYELFIFRMNSSYAHTQATFFGMSLPMDNRTFDSSAFSVIVSALTYLLSQYIPKRLGNKEPAKLWISAFLGGLILSGLANANALAEDITGQQFLIFGDNYWTWVIVGFFLTFLLAFFVGIDAWDARRKKEAQDKLDAEAQRQAELDRIKRDPRKKHTPNKHIPNFRVQTQATASPVKIKRNA